MQDGYQMFSLSDARYMIDFLFYSVEKVHSKYSSAPYYFSI
jgi:hypothetical protein